MKMDPIILETERLLLRRFQPEDRRALYLLLSDPEVNRFLPWFPVKSEEEAEAFYQDRMAKNPYCFAICPKGDGAPMGYIQASAGESRDLGYALGRAFWHKGIAAEAGAGMIRLLREEGFPFITATHDRNNPRSGEVMRRLGMKYCYSYEEQWQPKNIPVVFRLYQLNLDGQQGRVYQAYKDLSPRAFVEEGL